MQALTETVGAELYRRDEQRALLLDETASPLYLRYALIVRGTQRHVFPALLLDDWGRERNALSLYRWIYDEGQRFPRAELFGFNGQGREIQIFLRELEIFFRYPCYAYREQSASTDAGHLLDNVVVLKPAHGGEPVDVEAPDTVSWPLRHSAVQWQQGNRHALAQTGWEPLRA